MIRIQLKAKAVAVGYSGRPAGVLAEPAPFVAVSGHGDAAIEMILRVWCKTEDYWTVYYYIMEEVINRFREAGISIPYPQLDVHMTKEG